MEHSEVNERYGHDEKWANRDTAENNKANKGQTRETKNERKTNENNLDEFPYIRYGLVAAGKVVCAYPSIHPYRRLFSPFVGFSIWDQ